MGDIAYEIEIKELRKEVSELKQLLTQSFAEIKELRKENALLRAENINLKAEVKDLKSRLSLTSSNSSKPPSSDINRQQSTRKSSGKKAGGQKGHKGDTLKIVSNPDKVVEHQVSSCSNCGYDLSTVRSVNTENRQVFDLPVINLEVTEHRSEVKYCNSCDCRNTNFPVSVNSSVQYGNRIKSFAIYLNNYQLIPYDRAGELVQHLLGTNFNVSSLFRANNELYDKLEFTESLILKSLLDEILVHADETGFKINAKGHWLHSYSTKTLTYYSNHGKRGSEAMNEINFLPNYSGIIVHDFLKSYFSYGKSHSLCNAHHLRELNFQIENENSLWAQKMKDLLLTIKSYVDVAQINNYQKLNLSRIRKFEEEYNLILNDGLKDYPETEDKVVKRGRKKQSKGKNLLDRLINYREEVLKFMYNFEVPFDNNQAERDIRMMKLKQKISRGFRTEKGANVFCRIRSFISTVKKRSGNILNEIFLALEKDSYFPIFIGAK